MAPISDKVTIYYTGIMGNVVQRDGHFLRLEKTGPTAVAVVYRAPRGRTEYMVSGDRSSFWAVADGWGHPRADALFAAAETQAPGVSVAEARYTPTDPAVFWRAQPVG